MSSFEVRDINGQKIAVGNRVLFGDPRPDERDLHTGEVTEITEPDADYDDELGRGVQITPRVVVRFPDGSEERTRTINMTEVTWADYPDGPAHEIFEAEEIELT